MECGSLLPPFTSLLVGQRNVLGEVCLVGLWF
jgi:hypothetical protein